MRSFAAAFAFLTVVVLAACGGSSGGPFYPATTPTSSASGQANVSFLIVVPSAATTARKRPNVTLPSNAQSISFVIDSVNGQSYSGSAVTENLSTSNSACASVSGQLSCAFSIAVPPGTDVITVKIYGASNALIAEGNVSVTVTAGATVNAPLTLTGSVAKIAVTVGSGVSGVSSQIPVTVQALDANGATILGTYANAITLSDADSSGQTALTTSGSDNPPAGQLLGSSDTATLAYAGGAMSKAATISATASGLTAADVTPGSFLPQQNDLAVSGNLTYGYSETYGYGTGTQPPSPYPYAEATTFPVAVATGQTFAGASNLTGVTGFEFANQAQISNLSPSATTYYAWSSQGNADVLGYVGFSDPDTEYWNYTVAEAGTLSQTCTTPYMQSLVLPLTAGWDVRSGSGPCAYAFSDGIGDTDASTIDADGSYTDTYAFESGSYGIPTGEAILAIDAKANIAYSFNSEVDGGSIAIAAPSPNAATLTVTYSSPNPTVTPFYSDPAPTTPPNPWSAIGLPNGLPPSPLQSDTFATPQSIAALPAGCAVMSGLVPTSNPPLTEADETYVVADPMEDWAPLYTKQVIKHYYLNGVGEICNENQTAQYYFDSFTIGDVDLFAYSEAIGSGLSYYLGYDTTIDTYSADAFTYITQTTLTASYARTRSFSTALQTATAALHALSEAQARASVMSARRIRRSTTPAYASFAHRMAH